MKTLTIACVVAAFVVAGAAKADDFFMDAGAGIKGDSTVKGHAGEINVLSFSLGMSNSANAAAGGGGGAGKTSFKPIVVYKYFDVASPPLFLACSNGQHIPTVVLKGERRVGGSDIGVIVQYITITLTDVIVTAFNDNAPDPNGAAGEVAESLSLNFAKIQISYKPVDASGKAGKPVTAGWDLATNKKL